MRKVWATTVEVPKGKRGYFSQEDGHLAGAYRNGAKKRYSVFGSILPDYFVSPNWGTFLDEPGIYTITSIKEPKRHFFILTDKKGN